MATPDSQVPEISALNSTIVRSLKRPAPALVRGVAGFLARLSPELAARLAQRRFFTPPRAPLREAERQILDGGRRFRIEVDGRAVVGWRWGEGPVALLVHGWGGHAGQMTELVAPLVRAGFEAVAIDLPGHGASAGSRSSIVHFARAIEAMALHLGGIDVLLAHSFGAAGSTLALSRGLRARRAVFLAPPASFHRIWARFRAGAGIPPPVWQRLLRRSELWLGMPLNGVEPVLLAPRLSIPLLILHDAGDRELPLSEGEELAAAWPGAVLRRLEGLGHLRLLKDPACLHEAVSFVAPPAGQRPYTARRAEAAALALV